MRICQIYSAHTYNAHDRMLTHVSKSAFTTRFRSAWFENDQWDLRFFMGRKLVLHLRKRKSKNFLLLLSNVVQYKNGYLGIVRLFLLCELH